jgi:hypothetical protein
MTEDDRARLIGAQRTALAEMRRMAETSPSRALSLAITNAEQSVHWLQDPQIMPEVNAAGPRTRA